MATINQVIEEVAGVLHNCKMQEYDNLVDLLRQDVRFFFTGEGRSGLVAKMIAMRLMHSGKRVFVTGETTTPSIRKGDALIVITGSGSTPSIVHVCKSASQQDAYVFAVTTNAELYKESWCDGILHVPAATKQRAHNEPPTIQPLGNQFDQSVHLLLDAAIIDSLSEGHTHESLRTQHTNLE
ncbi:6-phospho-3-hexuloisomerase [Paenibacillus xerothermodurans]|uniref:SIS domain-containing protein n=1 Tax=Paenibacillus xerothermodurans TaxID=1977292 RepID=A0A2W1NTQ2_PAEXE|nr:6-phospho-3-hexuloisomerase [Paenibacillus xerothermodurans]PZE21126.1 SIS domain-containing protein [Paenibacillus xerothermodurans]